MLSPLSLLSLIMFWLFIAPSLTCIGMLAFVLVIKHSPTIYCLINSINSLIIYSLPSSPSFPFHYSALASVVQEPTVSLMR
jgi:hypothetical protein